MKKSLIKIMTLLFIISILASCNNDNNNQTDIKENDDIGEVVEREEDTNEESEEVADGTNDSVEDQRDLTLGETGTFKTTLGTYEVTLESAEIVGSELDGESSLLDELIVLELSFKNIGDNILLAEEIMYDMQITEDLETSGNPNGAEEFDSIDVFEGEIQPGEEKAAQFIGDIYTADQYFFSKAEGNVAAGTSNQVIWTIQDAEARND